MCLYNWLVFLISQLGFLLVLDRSSLPWSPIWYSHTDRGFDESITCHNPISFDLSSPMPISTEHHMDQGSNKSHVIFLSSRYDQSVSIQSQSYSSTMLFAATLYGSLHEWHGNSLSSSEWDRYLVQIWGNDKWHLSFLSLRIEMCLDSRNKVAHVLKLWYLITFAYYINLVDLPTCLIIYLTL